MLKYIFIAIFFTSCTIKQTPLNQNLEFALFKIVHDKKQSFLISKDIQNFAKKIKKEYNLTSYPNWNNFLINIGLKKRGLCWQLAYDLLNFLKPKYKDIDYYIAGANINSYFKEHNVLVLTCKKCKFNDGLLIDLWRNGGEVYFSTLDDDKDFTWKQRGSKR